MAKVALTFRHNLYGTGDFKALASMSAGQSELHRCTRLLRLDPVQAGTVRTRGASPL